jgi:hypothetical protein
LPEVPLDPRSGDPAQPQTKQPFAYSIAKGGWQFCRNMVDPDDRALAVVPAGVGLIEDRAADAAVYVVPGWQPNAKR